MNEKASILLSNLIFPLVAFLTGCAIGGVVVLSDGFKMPARAMEYTCEGIMPSAH